MSRGSPRELSRASWPRRRITCSAPKTTWSRLSSSPSRMPLRVPSRVELKLRRHEGSREGTLDEGAITVRRSYGHDTTKGGRADVLPIAPQFAGFLEEANNASKSQLVFPAADGSMRTDETDLQL